LACHIGVLVSGRGTNMVAIVRAVERGYIKDAKVSVVISDNPDARALSSARRHGLEAVFVDPSGRGREAYDRLLLEELEERGVTTDRGLVALAGFMRILSPFFVNAFRNRIMNIHPALLPSFPGLRAQEQALERGVKVSGCTVHFVVPEVDSGPIILQKAVEVEEGDTPETLAARILRQEHRIYPLAVKLFVEGKLTIVGKKVRVRN
jgi:phosphoribosylglycinamide formyltransferase 1